MFFKWCVKLKKYFLLNVLFVEKNIKELSLKNKN